LQTLARDCSTGALERPRRGMREEDTTSPANHSMATQAMKAGVSQNCGPTRTAQRGPNCPEARPPTKIHGTIHPANGTFALRAKLKQRESHFRPNRHKCRETHSDSQYYSDAESYFCSKLQENY